MVVAFSKKQGTDTYGVLIDDRFITENPETEYNVKIKKKDGSYRTYSKTSDLPGLMTIDITEDILVSMCSDIGVIPIINWM